MSLYRAIEIWSKRFHEERPIDLATFLQEEGFPVVVVDCGGLGDTIYQLCGFVYIRGNNQIMLQMQSWGQKLGRDPKLRVKAKRVSKSKKTKRHG